MITHVVAWRFPEEFDGLNKAELMEKVKADLEALVGVVESIDSFSVGINEVASDAASDVVLLSTFADWEALDAYRVHPAHQEVAKFIGAAATERRVVDFES